MADRGHLLNLLTADEAARELRCSTATVARLRKAGRLGFVMHGGRPHYTPALLTEYLEASTCHATAPASIKPADTGWPNGLTRRSGASVTTTPPVSRSDGAALARATFRPQRQRSPN